MTIYAVGDIQGCLEPLKRLLDKAGFDPTYDRLISVGDVVNRGPNSLETLRFLKHLGKSFEMVLGNHELHLLAVAAGVRLPTAKDTLDDILSAADREDLTHWLKQQPLVRQVGEYIIVHAGIPPQWSSKMALQLSDEVSTVLKRDSQTLLNSLYGNEPDWSKNLTGTERWRAIINAFTRMRFCDADGHLNLTIKTSPKHAPAGMKAWFKHKQRKTLDTPLIFGHWAALEGRDCGRNLFPLDTGCIWGGRLRLFNLDSRQYLHLDCKETSD